MIKVQNAITVNADGVSDLSVKADLSSDVDGTTINPTKSKAGDVKQFGQESGYNFNATPCSRHLVLM